MMKRISIIILLTGILLSACRKNTEENYTLKFYGDARQNIGYSISIASDGYIIGGQLELIKRANGRMSDTSNKNIAVIKTDWDGNIKWQVTAGGRYDDYGSKLYQLADGSMICVGTLTDTTSVQRRYQVFAMKLSPTGSVIWKKAYDDMRDQYKVYNTKGKDIIESSFGYIILGSTDAPNTSGGDYTGNIAGNTDMLVIRIDQNGDFISSDPAGFAGNEEPASIVKNSDNSFVLLGTTDRAIDSIMKLDNIFLVKVRSDGILGPYRIFGTEREERSAGMLLLNDGYLVAGTTGVDAAEKEAFVEKLPLNIFNDTIGKIYRTDFKVSNKLATTVNALSSYSGGNFLLGGFVNANPGLRMAVFEIGPDGNPVEGKQMIKGSTGDQVINDVVSGDDGYIIAVGSNTYEVNSMISFLKFKF